MALRARPSSFSQGNSQCRFPGAGKIAPERQLQGRNSAPDAAPGLAASQLRRSRQSPAPNSGARDGGTRPEPSAARHHRRSLWVSQLKSGRAARPRLRRHSHASSAPTPPPASPRHVGAGRERQGAGPLVGLVGRSRGRGLGTGRAEGMAHCEPVCFSGI